MSVVTIDLLTDSPSSISTKLGMLLAPGEGGAEAANKLSSPTSSNVTLVAGWEHDKTTNGSSGHHLGPIQRSGLVRLGDRLVRINGKDVTSWTFREVMDALKELTSAATLNNKRRLKTLGFAPSGSAEWSRGTQQLKSSTVSDSLFGLFNSATATTQPHLQQQQQQHSISTFDTIPSGHVVHSKRLYSFVSYIAQWRVAHEEHDTAEQLTDESQQIRQNSGDTSSSALLDDQQQRQNSATSNESELERQLNKEPTITYDNIPKDDDETEQQRQTSELSSNTATTTAANKPYIQYEIQCHILFRSPNKSFRESVDQNNTHYSWSTWKRYSELQTLDEELRYDFGWQMDALHDGRGFIFPSSHGLESWWYGLRNGGGVLTSVLGGSSGVADGEEGAVTTVNNKQESDSTDDGGGGWTSSLYGLFGTSSKSGDTATSSKVNGYATPYSNGTKDVDEQSTAHNNTNCPFPSSFIDRRKKELSSYWTDLMMIEDIFEFSDLNSHKFGKTMASFLEVDKVLLARKSMASSGSASIASGSSRFHRQHPTLASKSQFPAIHEDETEMFGAGIRPSLLSQTREDSGFGNQFHDDDISLLSDGTGAFADVTSQHYRNSPVLGGGKPTVVDIVPNGNTKVARGDSALGEKQAPSSSSVASSSVSSRRRLGKTPRAQPAFKRQFMTPP